MKQSVIHWREINMRAREHNLPDNGTACLVMIPGKQLVTASFWERTLTDRVTKPYFVSSNDYIKPVTGMLWVPVKEVLQNGAT